MGRPASIGVEEARCRVAQREKEITMKSMNTQFAPELVQGDAAMVNASMSQVEMTMWLCVMAVLAGVMLALLAMVGR